MEGGKGQRLVLTSFPLLSLVPHGRKGEKRKPPQGAGKSFFLSLSFSPTSFRRQREGGGGDLGGKGKRRRPHNLHFTLNPDRKGRGGDQEKKGESGLRATVTQGGRI